MPVSGRQRGDVPEIAHDRLSVEVEHRTRHTVRLREAIAQAAAASTDGRLPVAILHEQGGHHADDLCLLQLSVLARSLDCGTEMRFAERGEVDMRERSTLSAADRGVLDTLTAAAIAQCRAAGITNDAVIASATSEIVVEAIAAHARTGDPQAHRLLRHLLVMTIAGWMEDEEAAGCTVPDTATALLERMLADVGQQHTPEA